MYLARLPKFLNPKDYSCISGHERHYSFASQLHHACDPLPYCRTSPRDFRAKVAIGQPLSGVLAMLKRQIGVRQGVSRATPPNGKLATTSEVRGLRKIRAKIGV